MTTTTDSQNAQQQSPAPAAAAALAAPLDPGPAPPGIVAPLVELLQAPDMVVARSRERAQVRAALRLFGGAMLCAAAYGASSGFFQGGSQILLSMLKAPLIIAASVALCAPSLFVFSSLAGARLSGPRFVTVLAGFSALLGLLMVGFLPISWLFSVSSKSLLFVVWLHVAAWALALYFAGRFVTRALNDASRRTGLVLWLLLFLAVSFQVATVMRPVLWRTPDGPLFESGKRFFTEQLDAASDFDGPAKTYSAPGGPAH
jgi:hypothetical protein